MSDQELQQGGGGVNLVKNVVEVNQVVYNIGAENLRTTERWRKRSAIRMDSGEWCVVWGYVVCYVGG